jgi:hypothetical protein
VIHPDDPRGPSRLPSYITGPQPKEKTLDKARAIIEKMDYPERVATSDLYDEFAVTDAGRMLYFLGYRPSAVRGKRGMRLWDAPEELDKRFRDKLSEESVVVDTPEDPPLDVVAPVDIHEWAGRNPVSPEDQDELDDAIERHPAGSQIEEPPAEEPVVEEEVVEHTIKPIEVKSDPNGREYIDTDDSWVIDLKEALGEHLHRMVTERLAVLRVVGIEYEMRVWRKK